MTSPDLLNEKDQPHDFHVQEAEIKQHQLNRFLYQLIGSQWSWVDKLSLSDQQWQEYAERDNLKTWVAYFKGSIAGYYELEQQGEGDVEIMYFGLAPNFIGKGFGGYLLTHAVKSAWNLNGAQRVWVHTCSLDHKNALSNYIARGFKLYREDIN